MEKCCAVAFFNAQCIILHLCGDREHIFGFAQAHGGRDTLALALEPQLLCVSDIFIHSRSGIANIVL